ncbi:hypothetical protein HA402_002886 [Bradysia odoriphaga]|nr:hypothetical protein HA402_002886 [Bradysia odoriphaga]
MIGYCPEDPSQTSHCIGNTIHTSVIAGFLLIFGSFQLYVYRKYSTHHRYVDRIVKSKLFNLQIYLTILVPALALLEFIVQSNNDGKVYGFMITAVVLTCFAFVFSTCLILTERYYRLQSVTTRGHGPILLVFWTLALIAEILSIIYLQLDDIEIIFFVLRFASLLLIFILGFKAPGIVKDNDDGDRLLDDEIASSVADPSIDFVSNTRSESPKKCEIRTTIIVPYQLSTLIKTDEIIVLSEGVIVEKGRHDDLLVLNGAYANVWSNQLQNLYLEQNVDDPLMIGNEETREEQPIAPKSPSPTRDLSPLAPNLPSSPILPLPSLLPPSTSPVLTLLSPVLPPPVPLPPVVPPPVPPPQPVTKKNNVPKPGKALKSFNWSKLSDMRIQGTIWSEYTDSKLYANVNLLKSIDTIFSADQKNCIDNDGNTELLERSRLKNISVIDGRRAQNCTILLSRLKLSDEVISQAILSMDLKDQIPTDMVEQLLKFTPSAEEKFLLEEHSKNIDSLVRADRFLYEMSQIPDYENRLQSLLYKKQFPTTINDLLSRITSVKEASRQVKRSKKLKKLLEIVLDLGNYMNYGPRGNASGFHLTSLNRLTDTKSSSVKNLTLLHFLVQLIEKEFEDLMVIPEEISQVRHASKVSLVELDNDMDMLRTGLTKVSVYTTNGFYEQATVTFEELENQLKEMKMMFDQAARRFGEDRKDKSPVQPDEFFGILNDFLNAFEEARQFNDNSKKLQEDGEKRVKKETALKKSRTSMSEKNLLKADTKDAVSVLSTDGEMTKSTIQKTRLRETRESQNNQRQSLYSESRERSIVTDVDL